MGGSGLIPPVTRTPPSGDDGQEVIPYRGASGDPMGPSDKRPHHRVSPVDDGERLNDSKPSGHSCRQSTTIESQKLDHKLIKNSTVVCSPTQISDLNSKSLRQHASETSGLCAANRIIKNKCLRSECVNIKDNDCCRYGRKSVTQSVLLRKQHVFSFTTTTPPSLYRVSRIYSVLFWCFFLYLTLGLDNRIPMASASGMHRIRLVSDLWYSEYV